MTEDYIVEVWNQNNVVVRVYFERLSTALDYISNTLQGAFQVDPQQIVSCSLRKDIEPDEEKEKEKTL